MNSLRSFYSLLLSLVLLFELTHHGSVPVVWTPSSFFRAGTFNCVTSTSGVLQQFSASYATPLSGAPAKKPSMGITGIDYTFNSPRVYLKIQLQSWTSTGLLANLTVQFSGTFSMKINYLSPDPSMTYQYSSFSYSKTYSGIIGPFVHRNSSLGISGLNPGNLDMTHENIMIGFLHFLDLSNTNYCFHLGISLKVISPTGYDGNYTSTCAGMSMNLIGWSRIVFDRTAIQALGFCYFKVGKIYGYGNDDSTLVTTFNPFLEQNFIMGMTEFKYTSGGTPIRMGFTSTQGDTTFVTKMQTFETLVFEYWGLRYRNCPVTHPYFSILGQLCHDYCPDGTYMIATNLTCAACHYSCEICLTFPACSGCSALENRVLNGGSCSPMPGFFENGTDVCPPCLPNCISCTNDTICLVCQSGYQINTAKTACDSMCDVGCSTCTNFSTCYSCLTGSGYYLVNTTCEYCNATLNYFLDPNNITSCQPCVLEGCIQCSSLASCSLCNISDNYAPNNLVCQYCNASLNRFINPNNHLCQDCVVVGCAECSSLTVCVLCNISEYYLLNNQTCDFCDPALNYYIHPITLQCQLCTLQGCTTCFNESACSVCNTSNNYFLNSTNDQCQTCTLEECIQCSSLTSCLVCNTSANFYLLNSQCDYCNSSYNNFINSSTLSCQPCSLLGCTQCASLTICTTCDNQNNFYLLGLTCDFCNNSLNEFINPNTLFCEACILENCIMCADLLKCKQCNQTDIAYFPNQVGLCEICELEGCIECESLTKCKTCDQSQSYSLDVSGLCDQCSGCRCYTDKQLPSLVPSIKYSEQECNKFDNMDTVIYAVGIASFAVMFLASFSTCLVGIELIGVLQLAFLNLADNKYVHLFLSPLIGWFFVNGYNILPTRFGAAVPESIRQISHSNLFLENVNVMFGVLVLVTGLFLAFEFAVSKFDLNWPKTQTLVREVFMATYLFGCFNTAFSISIHCKYFSVDDLLTPLGILSSVCAFLSVLMYLAVTLWFIAARKFKWGEYTEKFKHDITNQMYIPLTMMYRFGLGLYMGFDNQEDNGTLLVLLFSFVFILYNVVNLPYQRVYHNYRANICHFCHLVILVVTNYYRNMKKMVPLEKKASINPPAELQIVSLVICVGVSLICTIIDIYLKIKQIQSKKTETENNQKINPTQQNLAESKNSQYYRKNLKSNQSNQNFINNSTIYLEE